MASTPIHSIRISFSNEQTDKTVDSKQKNSQSCSFGDSLDLAGISWERIEKQKNNGSDNSALELISAPLDLEITNIERSEDSNSYCDAFHENRANLSKRSSSPSPIDSSIAPQNKKVMTSSVSLFNSEDSMFFSSDSIDTFASEKSALDSFDYTKSPSVEIMRFNELKVGNMFKIITVDRNDLPSFEAFINKWITNEGIAIHFVVDKQDRKPKQIIGAKIKSIDKTENNCRELALNFNDWIITRLMLCFEGEDIVYDISSIDSIALLKEQLKYKLHTKLKLITFDIKLTYQILQRFFEISETDLQSIDWFDVKIAHWILNPENPSPNTIRELISSYIAQYNYLFLKAKYDLAEDISISIGLLFPLMNCLSQKLMETNLCKSYKRVELPSRLAIAKMELNGIGVDMDYVKQQNKLLVQVKHKLEEKACSLSNTKFKLSNPTDVANVLYKDNGLLSNYFKITKKPNSKNGALRSTAKLPKHLSTAKPVLQKLQTLSESGLPGVVMEWRQVDNALKKSIEPLLNFTRYCDDLNMYRIHGINDEWSSTGRISMSDPNLIGIRKDFDVSDLVHDDSDDSDQRILFSLRRCLIAREGFTIVSADFSQLELRILAHLSKDKDLRTVLNEGGDVFKNIASIWKSKSIESVTKEERQQAKQISYGMIYGIGAKSLSEQLSVTEEEANEFMDSFINKYTGIRSFMNKIVEECREREYVETINGRRRYLKHINDATSCKRSQAERQALNTTIQGSAADLLKTAMIAMDKQLIVDKLNAFIILQMHDELMYEVSNDCAHQFANLLRLNMESCSNKLSVDLPVVVKMGRSWGELEEIPQ